MNTIREKIKESYPDNDEIVFLEGFDDAITGTALCQGNTVVCYSMNNMVHTLMHRDAMTQSEAMEWLDHNTFFAYFGPHTPVYIDDIRG